MTGTNPIACHVVEWDVRRFERPSDTLERLLSPWPISALTTPHAAGSVAPSSETEANPLASLARGAGAVLAGGSSVPPSYVRGSDPEVRDDS